MDANSYVLGTTITIGVALTDDHNQPVDPAKITIIVEAGKGNVVVKHYTGETQDFRRVSPGVYEYDFPTKVGAVHTVTSLIRSKDDRLDTALHQFLVTGISDAARKELAKL